MKNFFYFFLLLVIMGCTRKERLPDGIMTREQMINFFIDIQLTEAKINTLRIPEDTVKTFYGEIEKALFKKHQVTDTVYFRSLQYYLYEVKAMEEIYSAVVDSLSLNERLSGSE